MPVKKSDMNVGKYSCYRPYCFYCKHLLDVGEQEGIYTGWTCKAFPTGIPFPVINGNVPHVIAQDMLQEGEIVYDPKVIPGGRGDEVSVWGGSWVTVKEWEEIRDQEIARQKSLLKK